MKAKALLLLACSAAALLWFALNALESLKAAMGA